MTIEYLTLAKRLWRSDLLWTNALAYRYLWILPLAMDTWALSRSQYWPRARLDALRDARLREVLRDAASVPYWKRCTESAGEHSSPLEMLEHMPVTAKKDLTARSSGEIYDPALLQASAPDHTSGSTGRPFHFYQDRHASLRSFAVTERIFRAIGKRYPVVYVRARERHGFTPLKHIWFYIRDFASVPYRIGDLEELGTKLRRGFVLYAYTSWLTRIAAEVEKKGIKLPVRAAMAAGEHLTPQGRAYIERVLEAEVFTLYASREVGFLGFECEKHVMHICEEWAYVEVLDRAGNRLPDGQEGRIVVTAFDNRVMPFIRYEIGDVGSLSDSPCECGRTLRTLTFRGRQMELIEFEDGRTVSLLDVAYAMGSYRGSIAQYQVVHAAPMSFTIKIVAGPEYRANKEYLELMMFRLLHPKADIRWEIVDHIPEGRSGKAVYYIRENHEL